MHISNPITPHSTEINQRIMYCKWQIKNIKLHMETAPACLSEHLRISLDSWLVRLAELQENRECTCNPINGMACPVCVEHAKKRYGDTIPIEGEL